MQKFTDISASHNSAKDAVARAIGMIELALSRSRFVLPKGGTGSIAEMRRDLPYCIHSTKIFGTQILVNRNYKPLGNSSETGENWVEYERIENMHVQLSPSEILEVTGQRGEGYLFGDENRPWDQRKFALDYLSKLERLHEFI